MDEINAHDITLRQLQIFWVVVHAGSLTRAAKQLEMRQPSISQQISRMEGQIGGKLIRFINGELRLTPAGEFLRDEAGRILAAVDSARSGLTEFFEGRRARFSVGALPSLARNLLAPAFARLVAAGNHYSLDILEMTPGEAIEQLNGRTIDAALITGYAARVRLSPGLRAVVIGEDAQLLAVPSGLADLADMADPQRELSPAEAETLNCTIRYAFGSEHTNRVNQWYDHLLPGSRMVARCRAYESALALVERGCGTAIVPELSAFQQDRPLFDVSLYALPVARRQTIVLAPDHHLTLQSLKSFLEALKAVAAALPRPVVRPAPRFALERLGAELPAEAALR